MSSSTVPHWADVLSLRSEVTQSDGSVGELQMSLHKAVYRTVVVPYRRVDYYVDITQPTPNLVGFFARVARRLGTGTDAPALFYLDQGMGGGKSHALVGLYHMASSPAEFFDTELGYVVRAEAEQGGLDINLSATKTVVLTADYFSPGKTSEVFGPATTLFERFIWSLVDGNVDRYQRYVDSGPNKATLQQALGDAGRPVLILLDELMDYVLQLSDATNVDRMPSEKAFLNALMDACDDVPRVAFVLVMIRSDLDERGYPPIAEDFRYYVAERIVRNGITVPVTEPQDFAAIIQRRLFEHAGKPLASADLARSYTMAADARWRDKVFDKLGPNRTLAGFAERVEANYPFHPELMRLVQQEWSQVQNFQRVRSTVAIFARTVLYWVNEHQAGRWAPALIGVGDIPLTFALEQVLSSGLLMNNDRAIQGYRSVATTDITNSDGTSGRAVSIDTRLRGDGVTACQGTAAVRMATALFCYSLVARPRAGRGATKTELLSAIFEPDQLVGTPYTEAEEVFNALISDDGLGALETTNPPNAPARYYLSIKQTLRMYFTASLALIDSLARDELVWDTAQKLGRPGPFDDVHCIDAPSTAGAIDMDHVFGSVDSTNNRLIVLDPRRWALLDGKDALSQAEINGVLGLGPKAMRVDNAASCVIACVNGQRRDIARKRAGEVLAWRHAVKQINPDEIDELQEANAKLEVAIDRLQKDIEKAFQHYVYLVRASELVAEFKRFDDDTKSSLRGDQVWDALVDASRASKTGGLSAEYLAALLDTFDRALTPREVVQAFYKNPAFSLVRSTDDIRHAMYDLLHEGWELVDSDGNPLAIASPGQISINSIQQTLRRRTDTTPPRDTGNPTGAAADILWSDDGQLTADTQAGDDPYRADSGTTTDASSTSGTTATIAYKRYIIELTNRSITSPDAREEVWQFLRELAKVIDNANIAADHQLLSLSLTLTTAEGHQGHIETKARQAEARVRVEDDEF